MVSCGRLLIGLFMNSEPYGPIDNRSQVNNLPHNVLQMRWA